MADIKIEIKDTTLFCEVPLLDPGNNETMSKIISYGALKAAEEQISIFFMKRAMQRQQLLTRAPMIKPVIH